MDAPLSPTSPSLKQQYFIRIVLIALAVVALGALFFYMILLPRVFPAREGLLLLNLAEGESTAAYFYTFDVSKKKLSRISLDAGFTPSVSPASRRIIAGADNTRAPGGVYILDPENVTEGQLFAKKKDRLPSFPQLSPDETKVAFVEPPINEDDYFKPSNWILYVADKGGEPRIFAKGLDPHWSPNGKEVLYVGDGGLRLVNIETGIDRDVWKLQGGGASARMKLDVSDDGTKLAWTNPVHGAIIVAQIDSWLPFSAKTILEIPVHAFWPTFSPDGAKLAYEEVLDWGEGAKKARLVIYNLLSQTAKPVKDLFEFNQHAMFMSDWVELSL